MDDELKQLEQTLRSLPLRKPPASLDARVLRRRHRVLPWAVIGGMAAAAAALLAAILWLTPEPRTTVVLAPSPVEAEEPFEPVRLEETFSQMSYEGIFAPDEKMPLRIFRHRTLERTLLVDQNTGYTVEMAVPREQLVLIEAEMY